MRRINSITKSIEESFIVFFWSYVNKKINLSIKDNIPLKIDYFYRSFDQVGLHFECNGSIESVTTNIEPIDLISYVRFAYKNEIKKYNSNKETYDFRY